MRAAHGLWITVPETASLKVGKTCWIDILSDELGSFTVFGEVRYVAGRRVGLETTRPVPIDESSASGSLVNFPDSYTGFSRRKLPRPR